MKKIQEVQIEDGLEVEKEIIPEEQVIEKLIWKDFLENVFKFWKKCQARSWKLVNFLQSLKTNSKHHADLQILDLPVYQNFYMP